MSGSQVIISAKTELLSLNIALVLANSVDPDEMPGYAVFHLGKHCLPKYRFRGFQYTKTSMGLHMHKFWPEPKMLVYTK